MPGMLVFRPGDGNETTGGYKLAITNRKRPSSLCLSRQGMANQANSSADKVALGGYILEDCDGTPDLILIGTGTELDLCVRSSHSSQRKARRSALFFDALASNSSTNRATPTTQGEDLA